MKQLTALTMLCLLVLASCQKPEDLAPGKDVTYTESDFVDSEAIDLNADKNGLRKSNMKVIIRKVNQYENTYRLVLKVDSVSVDLDGDGVEELLPLGDNATIEAALSVPNPFDPNDALVVFTQGSLTFRKQNENGYYVFVSDMFTTDIDFDYELVQLNYLIGRWKFDDDAGQDPSYSKITGDGQYYLLPNGKSVEQDPKVAKVKVAGRYGAGANAMFKSLKITTYDDPTAQATQVVFKGVVFGLNNTKGREEEVLIEATLIPTNGNSSIGVSNWVTDGCIQFSDKNPPEWRCADKLASEYTNLRNASGTFYLLNGNGWTVGSWIEDDIFSKRNLEK